MRTPESSSRRGFTLIEILVAIAVLVVVILICGQAFQAASAVARKGEASGDALQEAWTVKRQIEDDLSRINPDGALVIHSVEVPNDFNRSKWAGTGVRPGLINPNLPPTAPVRCDQLLFFTGGYEPSTKYGSNQFGQLAGVPRIMGGASMVSFGHGLQFPELSPYSIETPSNPDQSPLGQLPPQYRGHDVDMRTLRYERQDLQPRLAPFYHHAVDDSAGGWGGSGERMPTKYTQYGFAGPASIYNQVDGPDIRGDQPEARRWLLTRQAIPLADDDGEPPGGSNYPNDASKRIYRYQAFATESLFPADPRPRTSSEAGFEVVVPVVDYGRVDVASMLMGSVREALLHSQPYSSPYSDFARRPWFIDDNPDNTHAVLEDVRPGASAPGTSGELPGQGTQRDLLKSLMSWPRAERDAKGASRFDQGLTSGVLASGCSSFIVEWTWDQDTGETRTWQLANPVLEDGRLNKKTWHGLRYDPTTVSASDWVNLGLDSPPNGRQLWFGLPSVTDGDGIDPDAMVAGDPPQFDRRVMSFATFATAFPGRWQPDSTPSWRYLDSNKPSVAAPALVHPSAVDEEVSGFGPPGQRVREYWAVFGPNRHWPLLEGRDQITGGGDPSSQGGNPDGTDDPDPSYTPWPAALRITMVLHDPAVNLESGKEIQFVVELSRDRLQ